MKKKLVVPHKQKINSDNIFKLGATIAGTFVLIIISLMVFQLISESYPIWEKEGLSFVIGTDWNAVEGRESFGALPYILGTLTTAALAMAIGVPLSIGIAMFVSDTPPKIGAPLGFLVELLAAVPSIIYGLWGLYVFREYFTDFIETPLHSAFGDSVWIFFWNTIWIGYFHSKHYSCNNDYPYCFIRCTRSNEGSASTTKRSCIHVGCNKMGDVQASHLSLL